MSNMPNNNKCTTSGLLTTAGAVTTHDTTVTISFEINGQAYTKTAITTGATPTTDGNTGAAFNAVLPNKACVLLWCLNASGTVSLIQGPIVANDDSSVLASACQFPIPGSAVVPFAYTLFATISTASASGLLPGTANWNATGLTATTRNILEMPSRPVAA